MPSRRELKNKVIKTAKQTAGSAKSQLDQVLLKLEHPAVKKMAGKVAIPEAKDMIARLSNRILEQADAIRASLSSDDVKKATKTATNVAGSVAVKAVKSARKLGKKAASAATTSRKKPGPKA